MIEMSIINLTPHVITVLVEDDENGETEGAVGFGRGAREGRFRAVAKLPSAGVARAATRKVAAGSMLLGGEEIPIERTAYGEVQDLPRCDGETMYVVSLITAQAAQQGGRTTDDLLVVGEAVRNADGQIIGAIGFGRL